MYNSVCVCVAPNKRSTGDWDFRFGREEKLEREEKSFFLEGFRKNLYTSVIFFKLDFYNFISKY